MVLLWTHTHLVQLILLCVSWFQVNLCHQHSLTNSLTYSATNWRRLWRENRTRPRRIPQNCITRCLIQKGLETVAEHFFTGRRSTGRTPGISYGYCECRVFPCLQRLSFYHWTKRKFRTSSWSDYDSIPEANDIPSSDWSQRGSPFWLNAILLL